MIDKKRLIALARKLISINSENPGSDEYAIGKFVKEYCQRLGLKTRVVEFARRRSNVLALLPGSSSGHELLITPHLDTVPAGKSWKLSPFAGIIKAGKLYGLGSTDCKSNLACSMEVLQSLVEDGHRLSYDLLFAATAEEESGSSLGLIPLLDKKIITPDAALVLDADDFEIIVAQKGLMHLKVKLKGKKAHGAYPWLGSNAIEAAVAVLHDLKKYAFGGGRHKYLRGPTVNIGTIAGGDKVNVVADWCHFELDFRFLPGMSEIKLQRDLTRIIRRHARTFSIEIEGIQQPYEIQECHALVSGLRQAVRKIGVKEDITGSEGATTITFFQHKNIPAVATGFGTKGCAHIADEYVSLATLYKGALVLEEFLKNYRA